MIAQLVQISGWSMVNVNLVPAMMSNTSNLNRNSSYALSSGLREFGSFIGSLVGGFLPGFFSALNGHSLESPEPFSSAIVVSLVVWVLALIPIFMIKGGTAPPRKQHNQIRGKFPFLSIAVLFMYVYIRQASWASCQSFCNPYMDQELLYSAATIGTITAFGQIMAIVASLLVPKLLKRGGTGGVLIGATISLGLSLLLLTMSTHWAVISMGRLGVLVSMAVWLPTLQVYQMENVEESWRGLAYGSLSMAMGLGFATISYTGGVVIETHGYNSIFIIGALLSGIAVILMFGINQHNKAKAHI